MSMSKVTSQEDPISAAVYPADLEEFLAASPEKLASIDELTGDLEGKADFDSSD